MAKNLSELLAVVEHRTAEDRIAAPRPTEAVSPAAPMQPALAPPDDDTGVAMVTVRFDTQILARVDAQPSVSGSIVRHGCTLRPKNT
jgi:hypothetical protein